LRLRNEELQRRVMELEKRQLKVHVPEQVKVEVHAAESAPVPPGQHKDLSF
jgi:hypothetical protein